jgi:hypothetical protein
MDEGHEPSNQWSPLQKDPLKKAWRWAAAGFALACVAAPICGQLYWGMMNPDDWSCWAMPVFLLLAAYCWSNSWTNE